MQSTSTYKRANWFLLLFLPLLMFTSCLFVKGTPYYEETVAIENTTWQLSIKNILPKLQGGVVSTDNNLVIYFNNSLDISVAGTISFVDPLITYADNTNCSITFATTHYPNDTIIVDPDSDWMGSYSYSGLTIEGFKDFKGNMMEPISYSQYSFNTAGGNQPEVLSVSPIAGTLGFPASGNLIIVFNEAMDLTNPGRLEITSNARVYELKDGVSCSFYYATTNLANDTIVVDPYNDLPGNTYYDIYVENFRDTQGGTMLAYSDSAYNMEVAGLVSYWGLGDLSGDSGGNFYHPLAINGTYLEVDRSYSNYKAAGFNGTSDYIDFPAIDTTRSFSISVWMYPKNNLEGGIVSKNSVANSDHDWNAEFVIKRLANKQVTFIVGSSETFNFNSVTASYATTPNWYYHIVAICEDNGSSHTLSLYLNNTLMATRTESYARKTSYSSEPVQIGRYFMAGEHFFNGGIDDVRIFNYAITPAQITALYNE